MVNIYVAQINHSSIRRLIKYTLLLAKMKYTANTTAVTIVACPEGKEYLVACSRSGAGLTSILSI